jgi:cholesterol oxidase
MTTTLPAVSFAFTEDMKGFVGLGQSGFEDGAARARALNQHLSVHLTIQTDDLAAFLSLPEHMAQAVGYIESPLFGGRCPVLKGTFNLFQCSGDANRKTMRYRLFFETATGEHMTLSGTKHMQNNLGFDVWHDTTTLFTNVFKGFVQAADEPATLIHACGVIRIGALDFLRQLTTFQAGAATLPARLAAVGRFGWFFAAQLWSIYGPQHRHMQPAAARVIPLHTLQGVQGAEVSTHYATTGDGLGISLLRFLRAPCQDVVVLVPGLTASSDMFFMPEHQNLTQTLLDGGFTDVWTLDGRISNRQPYNLARHSFNVDDLALYDNPAALAAIRAVVGADARIHIISHCLGAMSVAMSLFGKTLQGVRSVTVNGVALTPKVNLPARLKLGFGPALSENLLGFEYLNPGWSRSPGFSVGKVLAKTISAFHHECNVPECHMTSFMWGFGSPVLFKHDNLADVTHRRTGDLFGGSGMNYYRHILKMLKNDHSAVKFKPGDAAYAALPEHYFAHAADVHTPVFFVTGQDNALFLDANVLCHQRLERVVPGRHQLRVFAGYGHADVIIGQRVARDVFPALLEFLRQHSCPQPNLQPESLPGL